MFEYYPFINEIELYYYNYPGQIIQILIAVTMLL